MTERERWIVYPLLFLALGAALRDKLFDTTMSRRIVCQELVVVDEGKYPNGPVRLARIGAAELAAPGSPRIGHIEVNGRVDAEGFFLGGMPLGGPLRTVIPGNLIPELYRAWQQATEEQQRGGADSQRPPGEPSRSDQQQPGKRGDAGGASIPTPPTDAQPPSAPAAPSDAPASSDR